MKVFNLTDVETPQLVQRGFVSHSIAVGDVLLAPGDATTVPDEKAERVRAELATLLSYGVVAFDDQPEAYLTARNQQRNSKKEKAEKTEEGLAEAPVPRRGR